MSSSAKGTVLRLLTPWVSSSTILANLGPLAKVQSTNLVLTSGRLTTEGIVRTIRELARLRDELLHTMRQLSIPRDPRRSGLENPDYEELLGEAQKQLEEKRKLHQETQARIESLQRQIEDVRKQTARVSELDEAGFASTEAFSAHGQFSRLLGRLPVRKLEPAQRALKSNLQEQAVFATGNRKKDWIYVLVAFPGDKMSTALQTLILYDFVQTEVPSSEEPDLKKTLAKLVEKKDKVADELELAQAELKTTRTETGKDLNVLADIVQDSLIVLRGVLKLGEGMKASYSFVWLEKASPTKVVTALSAHGMLVETE